MKKIFISLVVLMMIVVTAEAQPERGPHGKEKRSQLKAQKISFITSELSLSPDEAEKFWPVYNEFEGKREALKKEHHIVMRKCGRELENCSGDQVEEVVDEMVLHKLRDAELANLYHEKFKQVLPVEKVFKLYKAERKFKKQLLKQIRGHNGPPPHEE